MDDFNPFQRFDPDNFETFSVKTAFTDFEKLMGIPAQSIPVQSEEENVLANARQFHEENDHDAFVEYAPLSDFEKQNLFDRLNQLQYDTCNCLYAERSVYRKELFPLSMHVLSHTQTDIILKQLAQDCANLCLESASQDLDIQFLHIAILEILRLQKPRHLLRNTLTKKEKKKIRKFKHPLQAACEYQEKVLRKLDENFRKRTTYSHLLVHKSNGSRLEDDVMFLERECRKSLTDAMFQIQFKSVLELHHKHQNQRKKRPPHTKATRRAAKDLAYRYQDRNLRCFPEPFADPPIASKCPPWAGFWLRENMYRPKF